MKTAIIAFILFPLIGLSQKLTISDLTLLCSKKTWSEVNSIITKKGWNYHSSEQGDFESFNEVNWAYDLNMYDDKAKGWVTLYTYEGLPSKISYEVFNKNSFTIIENSIKAAGFKVTTTEILDNQVLAEYANKEYYLTVSYSTIEDDDDYYYTSNRTAYTILITKKGTIYDDDNGEKSEFDDDLNLARTYNLKDGKLNGLSTEFYTNGIIKSKSNWTNNVLNGANELFDENGILTERKNFVNGKKEGKLTGYYPSGKIKYQVTFVNDLENGKYYFYDENGSITSEETFVNGVKSGPFVYTYAPSETGSVEKSVIVTGNFSEDKRNGQVIVREYADKDTLQIQNYVDGIKNGKWIDFSDKKIEAIYYYSNDELEGKYTEYFTTGDLAGEIIQESFYSNGLLNGQRTVYYKSFIIQNQDRIDNEVYLPVKEISTFKNNFLDGFYSNTEFDILMAEGFYKSDEKIGKWIEVEYLDTDSNAVMIQFEGNYKDNLKNGLWEGKINNKLYISYTYLNGLLDGVSYIYNQQGFPKEKRNFKKDKITEVSLYENNQINTSIKILNRDLNGYSVEFQDNLPDLQIVINFFIPIEYRLDEDISRIYDKLMSLTNIFPSDDDRTMRFRQGNFTLENDAFKVEGKYINNQLEGPHITFYKNQKISKISSYEKGTLISESYLNEAKENFSGTLKYTDSNLLYEVKIKKGLRNGVSKIIDLKTKEIIEEVKYSKGIKKE